MATNKKTKNNKKNAVSMPRALHRMTVSFVIVFLAEALILGLGIALYFTNFIEGIDFKEIIRPEYWMFAASFIFALDTICLFAGVLRISNIRKKSDLDVASIIGGDVQEAYNFGQIGLVVTDDDGLVLWTNGLLKERSIDLLDGNILEWQPTLRDLTNAPNDMVVKVEVNGRHYNVRYLTDAHLYIFKDTTDYEQVSQYNTEQAVCIGIIMIDNYSDVAGKTEDDNNDLISKIRSVIFEYCKEYGVLLRRYRNDSYFAVCNFTTLNRMEQNKFAVLTQVHNLGKGQNVIPTLSIGFAHHFDDVNKLSEMASNAIDISMSRGGDQAVVSHYGEELKFYGGRTAALENTGRVQFRSMADSILGMIRGASDVFVSGHMDMDMDALGACLGVMAMCEFCGKPCKIIYDPKLTEKKTREALRSSYSKADLDRLTISPRDAEEKITPSTLFFVVDVSVPERVLGKGALENSAKTIVIDHHRRGEAFIDHPVLQYVDTSASSATEIMVEFIHYATANPRIEINPTFATLMLSGMFLDTSFFKSKATGIRTFEAAEFLKEYGADNSLANGFLQDSFEEYELVSKIAASVQTYSTGVVYCVADEKYIVDAATLSKVANQLITLSDIHASFVIGKTGVKEAKISARSDDTINVQLICEKMGGGGGHIGMAAALFPNTPLEAVRVKLVDALDTYLSDAQVDGGTK